MKINRRKFITGSATLGALTLLPRLDTAQAAISPDSYATLIDLTKCNGCKDTSQPLCVSACREGRKDSFPEPSPEQLQDYWPQKKHEDWSQKRHLNDRFTPYNWIFVQRVNVNGRNLSIPRRCMHCDNPPCAKLCPFGVNHKTSEGPVYINQNLCFGGAKCRSVCPWSVPQRQAGVGLYTLWQDILPVGGGVMFKCDLCRDRLQEGGLPHCIEACPTKAMQIGPREEIVSLAHKLKGEYSGDIYGVSENGGTSTIYVSPIPFSEINTALIHQSEDNDPKNIVKLHKPENILVKQRSLAALTLVSPIVGAIAALGLAGKSSSPGGHGK